MKGIYRSLLVTLVATAVVGCATLGDIINPPPPAPDETGKLELSCPQAGNDPGSWFAMCDQIARQSCGGPVMQMRSTGAYNDPSGKTTENDHRVDAVYQCLR